MRYIFSDRVLNIIYVFLFTFITGILICLFLFYSQSLAASNLLINEVCSNNFSVVQGENETWPDYVELYNPTDTDILIENYYLSDDRENLLQYSLNGTVVPARGHALILLSSALRLSQYGDELFLSDANGNVLDHISFPVLPYNTCYSRIQDGKNDWCIMSPTAGSSNSEGTPARKVTLNAPLFSTDSGFYETAFTLSLTVPDNSDDSAEIYYTLDGSDPDKNSFLYKEPLHIADSSARNNLYITRDDLSTISTYSPDFPVDKATVVRAVCYDPDTDCYSNIITNTYFVDFDQRTEYNSFPIVSIVTDPANLFNNITGIYGSGQKMEDYKAAGGLQDGKLVPMFTDENGVEHHKYEATNAFYHGREWEREAVFTFYNENHEFEFKQNVGIRISGQSSRSYGQKSLNIFGREIYDDTAAFPYHFFDNATYSTIKIRNGGSDHVTKLKDAFLQSLASDRDISTQQFYPCILFLNGEYWGLYNIRERYKEEYLENHYNINLSNSWIIDSGHADVGGIEAQEAYDFIIDYISAVDMTLDVHWENANNLIDIQSLIDCYCINLYINNRDMSFNKNMKLWRSGQPQGDSEFGDCRWRWMLYDMDISLEDYTYNTFLHSTDNTGITMMGEPLIQSLMRNQHFREQFYQTFLEIANTTFSYDRVHAQLMLWKERYENQTIKTQHCFNSDEFDQAYYDQQIQKIDDFFKYRYSYAKEYLDQEMQKYEAADLQITEGE